MGTRIVHVRLPIRSQVVPDPQADCISHRHSGCKRKEQGHSHCNIRLQSRRLQLDGGQARGMSRQSLRAKPKLAPCRRMARQLCSRTASRRNGCKGIYAHTIAVRPPLQVPGDYITLASCNRDASAYLIGGVTYESGVPTQSQTVSKTVQVHSSGVAANNDASLLLGKSNLHARLRASPVPDKRSSRKPVVALENHAGRRPAAVGSRREHNVLECHKPALADGAFMHCVGVQCTVPCCWCRHGWQRVSCVQLSVHRIDFAHVAGHVGQAQ